MSDNNMLNVSIEQSKLLGNALRVKIIGQLTTTPRTAKQVADLLGESGGNVHYHITKLYEGGLLDLVEEKKIGGVTEKYYQSRSKWFNSSSPEALDPVISAGYSSKKSTTINLRLMLTKEQEAELTEEFKVFLEQWVQKTSGKQENGEYEEFSIGVMIKSVESQDDQPVEKETKE
ncbi:helix-turn-helix domain-containing protein [Paenibacillus urinalis]|uniref:Helix-turn-helix domain-containing protein n=2 Tax=Paenibacillus TaxID=44249 RepID=A0ABY7XBX0_9BACL|nr:MULTISPECIES: helix-turn-helix domain-containing protein [Paenibacillus]OMC72190.1 transcriptional regulator [Paenibacillus sp. FSL H7-0326]WDH99577.1 helix-turn-helix domain-containing protein [Paenibacillus urinalis]WDI03211.1 helix-turn-helix domain-containing protein [Paenibacillus urinalis]SDX45596.1 Helix-turn-helix domain-containing protein [Paenibacillus sp. PDC88]